MAEQTVKKDFRFSPKLVKQLEKEGKELGHKLSGYVRLILDNREEIAIVKAIQDKLKK